MTNTLIANASKIMIGSTEADAVYIGSTLVYSSWTPDPNGHSYVDFGLPSGTLWATMNIGANSESDYGNYYQYGKGAAQYASTSGDSDYSGTENPLSTSVDTARQVWGGSWHMPTQNQIQELIDQCTWTWTTSDGVNGYSVSKNGKSIFFPAAGYWIDGSQYYVGSNGNYWSSAPNNSRYAYDLSFGSGGKLVHNHLCRHGFSVRGVLDGPSSSNTAQSLSVDGHDYVEIGGIKWATKNIGADNITDTGLYFQWGDTQGYTTSQVGSGEGLKYFDWDDYKYCNPSYNPVMNKYYSGIDGYHVRNDDNILSMSDDAARDSWGGQWRMPTADEYKALRNAVNITWTNNYQGSGVAGMICTDKTDISKVLFFPACGFCASGNVSNSNVNVNYWSSSVNVNTFTSGYALDLEYNYINWNYPFSRCYGLPIRAIHKEVLHNYYLDYFTIESLQDSNVISITKSGSPSSISLSYSTDNGSTWTSSTISATTTLATLNTGDKIIFKGVNNNLATAWNNYYRFSPSKTFKVYGNAMSLLHGDDFASNSSYASNTNHNLCGLFYGTTTLTDASNLILPATNCTENCCNGMFRGCTSLAAAPKLPATQSAFSCYSSMFEGCINLENAPDIELRNLSSECCQRMFCMNRNSKITTPKMTKSPILRVATGAENCYKEMFKGNGNLVEITCLMTSGYQCSNWVQNISSSGTFKKAASASWSTGTSGIPSGWTAVYYVGS